METGKVVLAGVTTIQLPGREKILESPANVVVDDGKITCVGECTSESSSSSTTIQLDNGYLAPPLTAFGSLLGLEEIAAEDDTQDGANSQESFSAAIDGLTFEGKNLEAAYAHGVTKAITAPKFGSSGHKGISAAFHIGAKHALEKGAILDPSVALHYTLTLSAKKGKTPSISSAVDELRSKLIKSISSPKKAEEKTMEDMALEKVITGKTPLVIKVHSADVIASLLRVKDEVEEAIRANRSISIATPTATATATGSTPSSSSSASKLNMVLFGGAESYILAKELAEADVGVILSPLFSYAESWDQRRALTGAPLTNGTAVDVLYEAGVRVAIGVNEDWEARDLFVQAGIVHANSGGRINESEALAMASSNIYEMLGLKEKAERLDDFIVFEGNPLTINSQLRAVADGRGGLTVWS